MAVITDGHCGMTIGLPVFLKCEYRIQVLAWLFILLIIRTPTIYLLGINLIAAYLEISVRVYSYLTLPVQLQTPLIPCLCSRGCVILFYIINISSLALGRGSRLGPGLFIFYYR